MVVCLPPHDHAHSLASSLMHGRTYTFELYITHMRDVTVT